MDIAIKADRAGLTLTASATSSRGAIPVDSQGRACACVRVAVLSSAAVHIRTGDSTVAATINDLLLAGGDSIMVDTSGMTHIAVLQAGISLGGLVQVMPYE